MRTVCVALLCGALLLVSSVGLSADAKMQQRTQVKMEGVLGSLAGMFGGKAVKEGVVSTIAVKGNRRMSTTDNTAELVDLDAEKVYKIDLRGKSYTVQTFDDLRKQFSRNAAKGEATSEKRDPNQPEMEFEVDVKKTGQQKTISGYSCEEVILTLSMHEKGKTVDQAGGMVITSDMWMAPKIDALNDNLEFERRYLQKLYGADAVTSAKDLAQAMAAFPGMKAALSRLQQEGTKMTGTPLLTTVTVSGAGGTEGGASADKGSNPGLGGLGGLLGRRKKAEQPSEGAAGGTGSKTRATILTTVTEVLSIESSVAAADVDIPAGFKQK